ncbi:MAG: hypothetical protein AAFN92_19220 [Bacteroidota bacterium]
MNTVNWKSQALNFIGVILGVLLAFYVNDKAEKSKQRATFKQIAHSLIEDLTVDIEIYDKLVPRNEAQSSEIETLVESILAEDVDLEQATATLDAKNYVPANSTYLSTKLNNVVTQLDDVNLKKQLSSYYELSLTESVELGELQLQFFLNEITPWLIEHTNMFDLEAEDIAGDVKLANMLMFYNTIIKGKVEQYKEMQEAAKSLRNSLYKFVGAPQVTE